MWKKVVKRLKIGNKLTRNTICSRLNKQKQTISVKIFARVSNFKAKLSDYFQGDYSAVIGTGMYRDEELKEMKLDIPVQFNGKAEIIGFTQYVAGLVMEYFPNYMRVQVTIKSVERPEAIIIREAKQDEPLVKILD